MSKYQLTWPLLMVVLLGCRSGDDTSEETLPEAVAFAEGPHLVHAVDGAVVEISPAADVALSISLPKEIPLYDSATTTLASTDQGGTFCVFETEDKLQEVVQFYLGHLASHGWTTESWQCAEAHVLSASSDSVPVRRLMMLSTAENDKTQFSLSVRDE